MARISRALKRIKQELQELIPASVLEEICRDLKYPYRKRKLDPLTTLRRFVQQGLNDNTAIPHRPHLWGLDFDPSADGDARKRLPLKGVQELVRRVAEASRDEINRRGRWRGHRTWLVDGSRGSMPDTKALQKEFGQPGPQKKGCGFPIAHLLGLFDAYSGMLRELLAWPLRTHDLSKVWALHPLMRTGDVGVGDRGFCSYAHIATLLGRGMEAVLRIHQRILVPFRHPPQRRRKRKLQTGEARWRRVGKLGSEDPIVQGYQPQDQPESMTQEPYDQLPESILVREVRFRIPDRGGRTQEITRVTTLLDPAKYTPWRRARLFKVRWQAEQDLRHLKTTLKMEVLQCRSSEGVRKELAAYALVYNRVCLVREKAARRQRVQPRRLSFVNVLRWLQWAGPGADLPKFTVNPLRPKRHEPRVVKRRPKAYDLMTQPRAQYKKVLLLRTENA